MPFRVSRQADLQISIQQVVAWLALVGVVEGRHREAVDLGVARSHLGSDRLTEIEGRVSTVDGLLTLLGSHISSVIYLLALLTPDPVEAIQIMELNAVEDVAKRQLLSLAHFRLSSFRTAVQLHRYRSYRSVLVVFGADG